MHTSFELDCLTSFTNFIMCPNWYVSVMAFIASTYFDIISWLVKKTQINWFCFPGVKQFGPRYSKKPMALAQSIIAFSVDMVLAFHETGVEISRPAILSFAKEHFEKTSGVPSSKASKKSVSNPDAEKCSATTAKGTRCTKACKEGSAMCAIHLSKLDGPSASEPVPTKKRAAGSRKKTPMHDGHGIGETSAQCSLCIADGADDDVDSVYKAQ